MKDEDYSAVQESCSSYEEFVEEIISLFEDEQSPRPFIWEFAFESLTESGSSFRRINAVG